MPGSPIPELLFSARPAVYADPCAVGGEFGIKSPAIISWITLTDYRAGVVCHRRYPYALLFQGWATG